MHEHSTTPGPRDGDARDRLGADALPPATGLAGAAAELARRVVAAREEERRRLGAELHDAVGTNLAVVKLSLTSIAQAMAPAASRELALLRDTQALLDDTILNIRELCSNLHATPLGHAGFRAALETHCARLTLRTGLAIEIDLGPDEPRFAPQVELMLLRIVQEALWNSVKHAEATGVRITCTRTHAGGRLVIQDNGRGFDATQAGAASHADGVGIAGMRERALAIAAILTLSSSAGAGTSISVDF